MWCEHDLIAREQRMCGGQWFLFVDVQSGGEQSAILECFCKCHCVNDGSAGRVDQHCGGFHQCQSVSIEEVSSLIGESSVQADGIGGLEQFFEAEVLEAETFGFGGIRVEGPGDGLHPEGSSQSQHFAADISGPDDSELSSGE